MNYKKDIKFLIDNFDEELFSNNDTTIGNRCREIVKLYNIRKIDFPPNFFLAAAPSWTGVSLNNEYIIEYIIHHNTTILKELRESKIKYILE